MTAFAENDRQKAQIRASLWRLFWAAVKTDVGARVYQGFISFLMIVLVGTCLLFYGIELGASPLRKVIADQLTKTLEATVNNRCLLLALMSREDPVSWPLPTACVPRLEELRKNPVPPLDPVVVTP